MMKALFALIVFTTSLSAFADPRPGHRHGPVVVNHRPLPPVVIRPIPQPRPMPSRVCQVVMTDRMNRVVRRYQSWTDYNGMCRDGLRQCNYDINRMGMWGYRCATVRW